MALNSVQKAVQGSIFYCYQIHLIVAVSKVILKSAMSICLSEANLLVLISAFRELQYCCMIIPAVYQIVTRYDSAVGFELNETEVWTIHIHCKNWKTVFNRKLPLLQDELFCVLRNIFRRCEAYLEAGGQHFSSSVKQAEPQGEDGLWIPGHCGLPVCVCVSWSSHDTFLAQWCGLWDLLYYKWRIDVEERSHLVLNN